MNVLVLFAHPNRSSFNGSVLDTVLAELQAQKVETTLRDLYGMGFNPLLTTEDLAGIHGGNTPAEIASEQAAIKKADLLVVIAPVWWNSLPAIMKGYFDRVFSAGFAYTYGEKGPVGLLTDKRACLITTSGADQASARRSGLTETIERQWIHGGFHFCGFNETRHLNLFNVLGVNDGDRHLMLADAGRFVRAMLNK